MNYIMRLSEKMPVFNYWPRGREIIHRLIMRCSKAEGLQEFVLIHTDESAIESIIFNRE